MSVEAVDKWAYAGWIILTCLILLVGAITLYVGVLFYRRRWLESSSPPAEPWTLEDLRRMRGQGELTEEEYQAMRSAIINAVRGKDKADRGGPTGADNRARGERPA